MYQLLSVSNSVPTFECWGYPVGIPEAWIGSQYGFRELPPPLCPDVEVIKAWFDISGQVNDQGLLGTRS